MSVARATTFEVLDGFFEAAPSQSACSFLDDLSAL
jgi:hypothetical protein